MSAFNGLTLFIGVAVFLIISRSFIPNSKNSDNLGKNRSER